MATLKGAYQRFVTSIIRLWNGQNEKSNNTSEEPTSDVTKSQEEPSANLVSEESKQNLVPTIQVLQTPDSELPSTSGFKLSTSHIELEHAETRRNLSSPDLSATSASLSVDKPSHSRNRSTSNINKEVDKPKPRESRFLRRDISASNFLQPPSFLRPQRSRLQRPKSVSDSLIATSEQEKPKLKKSPTFLKLSPSLFRSTLVVRNRKEENGRNSPESPRVRAGALQFGFSRLSSISKRIDGTVRRRTKTESRARRKMMEEVPIGNDKTMPADLFDARLRDYNTYYEERSSLQFKKKQDKAGNIVIDGMLNIHWGLKRSIRLQMADSSVKIRPQSQFAFSPKEAIRHVDETTTTQPLNEENVDIVLKKETLSGTILRKKISKTRESLKMKNEEDFPIINIENGILGDTRHRSYDRRRMALRLKNGGEKIHVAMEDSPEGPMRQKSVILRKRLSRQSGRKRFSINGHSYNHETSVFTPDYGSVTNVRVTSRTSCDDVIKHLLNKFRVENNAGEFSLFVVKETGERRELSRTEYPLITRVLSGPNENMCKIFLMDRHVHGDISSDVAQYIKLDVNILHMFVKKFTEEEERESEKLIERYEMYRKMLLKRISEYQAT